MRAIEAYASLQEDIVGNVEGWLPPVDWLEDGDEAIRRAKALRDEISAAIEDMEGR